MRSYYDAEWEAEMYGTLEELEKEGEYLLAQERAWADELYEEWEDDAIERETGWSAWKGVKI